LAGTQTPKRDSDPSFLAHFMIMFKPGVNELLSLNKKRDLVTK